MQSALVARVLRLGVFALLLTCALVAIALSETMWQLWRPGELPLWASFAAPVCFALLLVVFVLDRAVAVRREEETAPRAWIQVGAAVFLLSLLLPQEVLDTRRALQRRARMAAENGTAADTPETMTEEEADALPTAVLLAHEDDTVREATCLWLARGAFRPHGDAERAQAWLEALREQVALTSDNDPSPEVREACLQALGQLQGDGPEDDAPAGDGVDFL